MSDNVTDNKPPIGVIPKSMWDEKRLFELRSAINRYADSFNIIPLKWVEEYNEILKNKK
jgi:hypothetical protein